MNIFLVSLMLLRTYFTHSTVSIVDFESVFVSWYKTEH